MEIDPLNSNSLAHSTSSAASATTTTSTSSMFDVAISDYLMKHRMQIDKCASRPLQQHSAASVLKTMNGCGTGGIVTLCNGVCPCKAAAADAKPRAASVGSSTPTDIQPLPLQRSALKLSEKQKSQSQSPNGYNFTEIPSNSKFGLESTVEPPTASPTDSSPSSDADFRSPSVECPKCTEFGMEEDGELEELTRELPLHEMDSAIENPSFTAQILELHGRLLNVQSRKISAMGSAIAASQKALLCQQRLLIAAKKAQKSKSTEPPPIETLLRKVDIGKLRDQQSQQSNAVRSVETEHSKLMAEQDRLTKAEMALQEDLHTEKAVEDVVRFIKGNRRSALLIVQLLHKYQCERLNTQTSQQPKGKPTNRREIENADSSSSPIAQSAPAVVTIEESDEEMSREGIFAHTPLSEPPLSNRPVDSKRIPQKRKTPIPKESPKRIRKNPKIELGERMSDVFESVIFGSRDLDEIIRRGIKTPNGIDSETPEPQPDSREESRDFHLVKTENSAPVISYVNYTPHHPQFANPHLVVDHSIPPAKLCTAAAAEPFVCEPKDRFYAVTTEISGQQHYSEVVVANRYGPPAARGFAAPFGTPSPNPEFHPSAGTPLPGGYFTRVGPIFGPRPLLYATTAAAPPPAEALSLEKQHRALRERLEQIEYQMQQSRTVPHHQPPAPHHSLPMDPFIGNAESKENSMIVDEILFRPDMSHYDFELPPLAHKPQMKGGRPTERFLPQMSQRLPNDAFQQFDTNSVHSNDFDDILDLIQNDEDSPSQYTDSEGVQATNAIYEELRLSDGDFQPFTPSLGEELEEMNWPDAMHNDDPLKAVM